MEAVGQMDAETVLPEPIHELNTDTEASCSEMKVRGLLIVLILREQLWQDASVSTGLEEGYAMTYVFVGF